MTMHDEDDQGASQPTWPLRVAVLDDEPFIVSLVARIVGAVGCEAVPVESGRDLLALFEGDSQRRPDILIIDLVMPDMDGNEILLALRKAGAMPKVIPMTGYDQAYLAPARLLAGSSFVGALEKPFRPADLAALLRQAMRSE